MHFNNSYANGIRLFATVVVNNYNNWFGKICRYIKHGYIFKWKDYADSKINGRGNIVLYYLSS